MYGLWQLLYRQNRQWTFEGFSRIGGDIYGKYAVNLLMGIIKYLN